jgi:cephalosporin-C deacetylase-like acetyl esterase
MNYIDSIARTQIEARQRAIAAIQNRAAADRRKASVREKVLSLIGQLPERSGAVAVKEFGSVFGAGFRVEKLAYESLPGFWVTANLYMPDSGAGPFPAVVLAPGHGAGGKTENWSWGGNFARNGIAALAYDPLGQGERLQYYDAERKASYIGNPTGEHGEANIGPMLIGDNVARYMVNDAMRGVDYLSSRRDIDSSRIGAFGCSGGGTSTAYFAALDDRVKVAAVACYITSFTELLASPQGAQDAEQSIPHFIEQGLDFADWAEAFAPKPYAIVSTEGDMFPFAGARQTHDEVKRFYGLYGAGDNLQWITGPGGHGNLGPISPAIMAFFTKNLKAASEPTFTALRATNTADMIVTPTGQVATSIGRETVQSLNRIRAESLIRPAPRFSTSADMQSLQARLRQDIRTLTGADAQPGKTAPMVRVLSTNEQDGYRVQRLSLKSDGDTEVPGTLATPNSGGKHPAILILDSDAREGDVARLAKSGSVVLALQPRPTPAGTESIKSPYLGVFNLLSLRAFLVGETIIGLRIDDAIRAVDWLNSRPEVDSKSIKVYGNGPLGVVALHAAVLDPSITSVAVENTLTSYRMVVDQPAHRNVSEVVIPGVLRRYDVLDLVAATHPRPLTLVSPRDALAEPVPESEARRLLDPVTQADLALGTTSRVRLAVNGLAE